MKVNFSTKLSIASLILCVAVVATTALAFAQSGARVYLQEVEQTPERLVVDVMADNVTELYGAEFRLTYDPALFRVQDANPDQEGPQVAVGTLLSADEGFVVANQVDEAVGTITFAMTLLNPAPAVNGSGALARVSFQVLQNGPSTINVEHAKLVAVDLQTIPSETAALAVGQENQPEASAQNTGPNESPAPVSGGPPPAAGGNDFPWWIVAAVIMVLGILALGGFIVMGGLNKTSTTPAASPPQTGLPQRPPSYPRGSRPSAFKNQHLPTE